MEWFGIGFEGINQILNIETISFKIVYYWNPDCRVPFLISRTSLECRHIMAVLEIMSGSEPASKMLRILSVWRIRQI